MTNYYELGWKLRDNEGTRYSLDSSGSAQEVKSLRKAIEDATLTDDCDVAMEIDMRTGTGRKRLGDIVYWQKGSPNAHVLIVSNELLDLLRTFALPPYRTYTVRIKNDTKLFKRYFIFHLLGNVFKEIDFRQQTFSRMNIHNDAWEGDLENGEIVDYNHYLAQRSDLIRQRGQTLFFKNVCYKNKYDVLWGFPSLVLVDEKMKAKIEDAGFLVRLEKFDKYPIRQGNG